MDLYTLILVGDERSPVRRFQIPRVFMQRAAWFAAGAVLFALVATWDYWRLRAQNSELPELRAETSAQADQIREFKTTLAEVQTELDRVRELERKVRIIANLPGATASGGNDVTERVPAGDLGESAPQLPTGVPIEPAMQGGQGGLEEGESLPGPLATLRDGEVEGVRQLVFMEERAGVLTQRAVQRGDSMFELVGQLQEKSNKLQSMPSIWPVKGWLTSRYGSRISPFTGRRQMHSGIDIASKHGQPIFAPARGRVVFVGRKGPLGKSIWLDHGFGVRTLYGHTSQIHVATGDRVERGQEIASVGSTGRSTGPHLHYTVEVNGKSRDPLDYIFD